MEQQCTILLPYTLPRLVVKRAYLDSLSAYLLKVCAVQKLDGIANCSTVYNLE